MDDFRTPGQPKPQLHGWLPCETVDFLCIAIRMTLKTNPFKAEGLPHYQDSIPLLFLMLKCSKIYPTANANACFP